MNRKQRQRVEAGLCFRCENLAMEGMERVKFPLCAEHFLNQRLQKRLAGGFKPWKKGRNGRPPIKVTK